MLDANGRPIEVGDWVATPWPPLTPESSAEEVIRLPTTIKDAILGQVVEIGEDFQGKFVSLRDGITYSPGDVVTLEGFEFVTCPECETPWPFDVRMSTEEECPFCNAPLRMDNPVDSAEEAELEEYWIGLSIGPVY